MLLSVDSRLAADASAVAPPMPVNSASMDFGKASQQVTQTLTGMLRELQPAPTKGTKTTKAGGRGKRAGSKPKQLIKRKQPVVVKSKQAQKPAAAKSKATVSKSNVAVNKAQARASKAGASKAGVAKKQTKAGRTAAVKPIIKHVVSKHAQRTVVIIPTQKRQRRTSTVPAKAGQRKVVAGTKKKIAPKPSSGRVVISKLGNVHHDLLLPSSSFAADTKDARLARERALREHRRAAQQLKELLRPAAPVQSVHHEYPRPPTALEAINEESNQMEAQLNTVLSKVGNGLEQHLCQTGVDCSQVSHSTSGETIKAPARVAVTMPPVVPAATLPPPPNQADAIAAGLHATQKPTAPPHIDRGIKDEVEAVSCPDRTLLNRASGYRHELGVLRRKLKDETSLGASEARLAFIQARIDRYHDKLESVLRKCHKKAFAATLPPPSTQQVLAEALTSDPRTLRKMRTRRVKQVSSDDRVRLDHVSEVATPEQVKKLAIFESTVTKAAHRDFEKRMSQMGSILKRNAPPAPILLGIESERMLIDGGGAAPVKTVSKPAAAQPATKKPTAKKASVTKSSTVKPAVKATATQTTVTKSVAAPRANIVPAAVQSLLKPLKQQVIQPSVDSTADSSSTDSSSESDSTESFWPPEALQLMSTFQTKLKQHVQTIVPPTTQPSAAAVAAAASIVNAVPSIPQSASAKSVASSNKSSGAGSGSGKKAAASQQQPTQSKSTTQSQSTPQSQTRQSAQSRQSSSSRIASASNAQKSADTTGSTDTAATQSPKKVAFSSFSKTTRLSSSASSVSGGSGVSAVSKVNAGSSTAPASAPQQTDAPNLGFSTYVKFNADGSLTMSALMWTLFIAAILGVVVAIALVLRRTTVVRRWLGLEDSDEQYQSMKQMSGDEAYHQAVMSVLDTAAGVNAKQAALEATERQRLSASASDSVASAMRPKAVKTKAPQQSVFASWGWGTKPQHASLYDN